MSNGVHIEHAASQAGGEAAAAGATERKVESALAAKALKSRVRPRATWHGTAFVLEAVVLLLFIAISMAVVCTLFAKSFEIDQQAQQLTRALTLATTGAQNGAETFAANPDDESCPATMTYSFDGESFTPQETYVSGMYTVKRTVTADATNAGVLYQAHIEVGRYNKSICTLNVSCYKSTSGGVSPASTSIQTSDDGEGEQ